MGLCGYARFQRHFHSAEHGLFVVLQHQGQDIDHFPVAARLPEQILLKGPEGLGHLGKGRAIAQGAGLSLDDGKVMAPVIDRPQRLFVRALDHPAMFADNLPLGCDHKPVGINPQADGAVGKGRRHAVAIALEADQACGRDPFALLDKAVEGGR